MQNETGVSIFFFPLVCSVFPDPNFLLGMPGLGGMALPKYLHGVCLSFPYLVRMERIQGVVDSNDYFLLRVIVHIT